LSTNTSLKVLEVRSRDFPEQFAKKAKKILSNNHSLVRISIPCMIDDIDEYFESITNRNKFLPAQKRFKTVKVAPRDAEDEPPRKKKKLENTQN